MIPLIYAEKRVCHGYGYVPTLSKCISTCSAENDQCGFGKKCCYQPIQPCSFHCVTPKYDIKKLGQCPTGKISDRDWYLCDASLCDVDNDCPDAKKCCPNTCGAKVCVAPE